MVSDRDEIDVTWCCQCLLTPAVLIGSLNKQKAKAFCENKQRWLVCIYIIFSVCFLKPLTVVLCFSISAQGHILGMLEFQCYGCATEKKKLPGLPFKLGAYFLTCCFPFAATYSFIQL